MLKKIISLNIIAGLLCSFAFLEVGHIHHLPAANNHGQSNTFIEHGTNPGTHAKTSQYCEICVRVSNFLANIHTPIQFVQSISIKIDDLPSLPQFTQKLIYSNTQRGPPLS
jgi:hypothetical protein